MWVDLIFACRHHVTMLINNCLISAVHARCIASMQRPLWQLITLAGVLQGVTIGDLNYVLCYDEKKGGLVSNTLSMHEFQEAMEECEMSKVQYLGGKYTWSNNRWGENYFEDINGLY